MSGQLVGEVIAAADSFRTHGLSERGFHALIAIAEKAETQSRRGSVRWDHIRAGLFGASLSTAKRAVADLKALGLVESRRGFNNQHGQSAAPRYTITDLAEWVTQVSQSPCDRTGHPDDPFATERMGHPGEPIGGGEWVKSGGRTGQIGDRTGHPDDLLDVPIDGPIDGGRARERDDEPPPRYCPDHPNGTPLGCLPCMHARQTREDWVREREAHAAAERSERRRALEGCQHCGGTGQIDVDENTIDWCPECSSWRKEAR